MKQLMRYRPELAAAYVAYLHALRNTGATLETSLSWNLHWHTDLTVGN
jgi:hypothetical protein